LYTNHFNYTVRDNLQQGTVTTKSIWRYFSSRTKQRALSHLTTDMSLTQKESHLN